MSVRLTGAADGAPELELAFASGRDKPALPDVIGMFDTVQVTVCDGKCTVRCIAALPGLEPVTAELVDACRALIQARSRAELMRELSTKNRQLARREAQLAARLRQIETVAYVTTHDLRGGADQAQYGADELAAILDDLPAPLLEEHGLRDIVANMQAATAQQAALLSSIDAIVELWKQDSITPTRIDAGALIGERVASLDKLARHRIHIGDLGMVYADRDMFVSIILHLLDNAVTYNDKPIKQAWVYRIGNRIHVRDNGNGIPADKLDEVMRVFQRLDASQAGMGVGLALCEAMVTRHGWTLTAVSKVSAGTTFTITMNNTGTGADAGTEFDSDSDIDNDSDTRGISNETNQP